MVTDINEIPTNWTAIIARRLFPTQPTLQPDRGSMKIDVRLLSSEQKQQVLDEYNRQSGGR